MKNETLKLGKLAMVRSGLVLARKQSHGGRQVPYRALNFRAIHEDGSVDEGALDQFLASEALSPDYVSQLGDVIVRLTFPYTAILIDATLQGMVISSNFVIIRKLGQRLLPDYLFWLLNTQRVREDIYRKSTSNMLGAVKASYFTDFEIEMIPLDRQEQIARMNRLARQEVSLLNRLAMAKKTYYAAVIDTLLGEERNHD